MSGGLLCGKPIAGELRCNLEEGHTGPCSPHEPQAPVTPKNKHQQEIDDLERLFKLE